MRSARPAATRAIRTFIAHCQLVPAFIRRGGLRFRSRNVVPARLRVVQQQSTCLLVSCQLRPGLERCPRLPFLPGLVIPRQLRVSQRHRARVLALAGWRDNSVCDDEISHPRHQWVSPRSVRHYYNTGQQCIYSAINVRDLWISTSCSLVYSTPSESTRVRNSLQLTWRWSRHSWYFFWIYKQRNKHVLMQSCIFPHICELM